MPWAESPRHQLFPGLWTPENERDLRQMPTGDFGARAGFEPPIFICAGPADAFGNRVAAHPDENFRVEKVALELLLSHKFPTGHFFIIYPAPVFKKPNSNRALAVLA